MEYKNILTVYWDNINNLLEKKLVLNDLQINKNKKLFEEIVKRIIFIKKINNKFDYNIFIKEIVDSDKIDNYQKEVLIEKLILEYESRFIEYEIANLESSSKAFKLFSRIYKHIKTDNFLTRMKDFKNNYIIWKLA